MKREEKEEEENFNQIFIAHAMGRGNKKKRKKIMYVMDPYPKR